MFQTQINKAQMQKKRKQSQIISNALIETWKEYIERKIPYRFDYEERIEWFESKLESKLKEELKMDSIRVHVTHLSIGVNGYIMFYSIFPWKIVYFDLETFPENYRIIIKPFYPKDIEYHVLPK